MGYGQQSKETLMENGESMVSKSALLKFNGQKMNPKMDLV